MIKQFHWEILYDERGNLVEYLGNLYYYDGDGNRVWAKDYEGYQASYPGTTLYVGNYYELVSDGRPPEQGTASVCTGAHCTYMPFMYKAPKGISYYYADGQRIAMRSNNTVSWLYGDQLGSVSAVAKADGTLISRSLYYPWGSERLTQGTSPTDYGYTGQMREGDIYYYNARWYDPQLGRFMQADTIVPSHQGTQGFDRYAYVNNNPLIFTDPSGYYFQEYDDYYRRGGKVVMPSPLVDYGYLIKKVYGINLDSDTPFSYEQERTVYNALYRMAFGAREYYGLPGSVWVKQTFGGTRIRNGGFITGFLGAAGVTLPNSIEMREGFDSSYVNTIIHEFGHILDNKSGWFGLGTYLGNSYSSELALEARVMTKYYVKFAHHFPEYPGAVIFNEDNRYKAPNLYGNASVSDYFAEGFKLMIINPYSESMPDIVRNYFIRLFGSMR